MSALGGIRTPNLLIRISCRARYRCYPSISVRAVVGRRPAVSSPADSPARATIRRCSPRRCSQSGSHEKGSCRTSEPLNGFRDRPIRPLSHPYGTRKRWSEMPPCGRARGAGALAPHSHPTPRTRGTPAIARGRGRPGPCIYSVVMSSRPNRQCIDRSGRPANPFVAFAEPVGDG